jgi:AAA domain
VEEPGRRIVKEEMLGEGVALPWVDAIAFARRAIALALADRNTCLAGWVFFDRGLIDAAAAQRWRLSGEPIVTIPACFLLRLGPKSMSLTLNGGTVSMRPCPSIGVCSRYIPRWATR